jgi:two-component system chemotaxis response regulator CheB
VKAEGTSRHPIRVLVVASSPRAHEQIPRILEVEGDIVVQGHSSTSASAVRSTVDLRPDVVILDLDLPSGGGLHAIEQIMSRAPTPILVLSESMGDRQSPSVVESLVAGALDALPTPDKWTPRLETQLRRTVRIIHGVPVIRRKRASRGRAAAGSPMPTPATPPRVVGIGASTGGPSALALVLSGLSGSTASVLVVQHLHADFTSGLVDWMSRASALPVALAVHGERIRSGRIYVAPGGVHLRLAASARLALDPVPATIHRPSVDELFFSLAEQAGPAAIGVLMTGMGDDGAKGLLAIQEAGGRTLAQDEASSAVFGMPAAARRIGAVAEMLPPAELARAIMSSTRELVR